jgi:hypothetical protein
MTFEAKVIQKSRKVHRCLLCNTDIPVGSIYVVSPAKDDETCKFESVKMCHECAFLMHFVTKKELKEGNFTEENIPNFLRKIRNEYRRNPQASWSKINQEVENG